MFERRTRTALGGGPRRDGRPQHRRTGHAEFAGLGRRLCPLVHRRSGLDRLSANGDLPPRRPDDHRPSGQFRIGQKDRCRRSRQSGCREDTDDVQLSLDYLFALLRRRACGRRTEPARLSHGRAPEHAGHAVRLLRLSQGQLGQAPAANLVDKCPRGTRGHG